MKKGFTLVELSIVLVIIGLLIGGILVGQSLIDSAKFSSGLRALAQYESAFSQFNLRYKTWPGDSEYFEPAGNGDGDVIDSVAGGVPVCGVASCSEIYSVWKHLSDGGILQESYSTDQSGGLNLAGVSNPEFMDSSFGVGFGFQTTDSTTIPLGYIFSFIIDPINSIAFDAKLDDGVLTTGDVRSFDIFSGDDSVCIVEDEFCATSIVVGPMPKI